MRAPLHRSSWMISLLLGGVLATVPVMSGFAAERPPGYAITGVTVVDVEAGRTVPGQTVLIAADKIREVGPAAEVRVPDGFEPVAGEGLFLMPGLFDAHVHYADRDTYGRLFIVHGVTFVREMGGFTEQVLELRDKLNRGKLLGPEMIATGAICDGKPPIWPFSEVCDTPEQGRAAVNKLADAGVDQIKVYSLLKRDVYLAILEEAKKRGLKAVGHVPESVELEEALKAGQASCEHLTGFGAAVGRLAGQPIAATTQPMRAHIAGFKAWALLPKVERAKLDELLKQVRESGMVQCPTLVVFAGMGRMTDPKAKEDRRMRYVSPTMAAFWQGGKYGEFSKYVGLGLPYMKQMVAELHRAGVPLMCGTDLANPYVFAGSSLHDEMAMIQDAGVPAADVLRSATIVPAKFCGVGDRLGSVAGGKTASLVLVRANPLDDVKNAKQIEGVFLRGRYFDRAHLSRLLRQAREKAGGGKPAEVAVELEVPGQVILRGRYTSTFNDMDAGDELFVISKADDGYHLMAHVRPKGGWSAPSVVKMRVDAGYAFRSAEWHEHKQTPTVARFVAENGQIEATAMIGADKTEQQSFTIPKDAIFSGPSSAMDYFASNLMPLRVGETKEINSVGFGYDGWKMQLAKASITRHDDVELERPDGNKVKARYYTSTMQIPIGTLNTQSWSDERGLMLKAVIKMPFGTIAVKLE